MFPWWSLQTHNAVTLQISPSGAILLINLHHGNRSVYWTPLYTPVLYNKPGVYTGIHFFLIFALKHRSWVLVRTLEPMIYVLSKNEKISHFHQKITIFTALKYCSILHGGVCVKSFIRRETVQCFSDSSRKANSIHISLWHQSMRERIHVFCRQLYSLMIARD